MMTMMMNYINIYVTKFGSIRGHPFMTSTKNCVLTPTPPFHTCVHMSRTLSPLWMSTCGRHEIHIALLKQLVQWPSGHKAEIRLYDCNLFKTVGLLLVIYITNLYRRKISTFYSVQRQNSGKKDADFFAWEEEDRMTSVDSNFNFLCGRPHGAWPPPLVHMRPPEPDALTPFPLLNGWPITETDKTQ